MLTIPALLLRSISNHADDTSVIAWNGSNHADDTSVIAWNGSKHDEAFRPVP